MHTRFVINTGTGNLKKQRFNDTFYAIPMDIINLSPDEYNDASRKYRYETKIVAGEKYTSISAGVMVGVSVGLF